MDIRTKKEITREEMHDKVCNSWVILKREYPTAKKFRLVSTIAEQMHMTPMGVRGILLKRNLYQSN